jgi:hypothetical protein
MNSSILFEANEIQMRFKKDQLSLAKEVTDVTLYRDSAAQNGAGNRAKLRQNRRN